MSISILFTDLRTTPSKLTKYSIEWRTGLSAKQVLNICLGETQTNEIDKNLKDNNREIIVSWYNKNSGEVSEIGGIGSIDWDIPDNTVLTISYENEFTTQKQIDESIEWTLGQEL